MAEDETRVDAETPSCRGPERCGNYLVCGGCGACVPAGEPGLFQHAPGCAQEPPVWPDVGVTVTRPDGREEYCPGRADDMYWTDGGGGCPACGDEYDEGCGMPCERHLADPHEHRRPGVRRNVSTAEGRAFWKPSERAAEVGKWPGWRRAGINVGESGPRVREVTDPDEDAPDGAVVDGYERVGDQWMRVDGAAGEPPTDDAMLGFSWIAGRAHGGVSDPSTHTVKGLRVVLRDIEETARGHVAKLLAAKAGAPAKTSNAVGETETPEAARPGRGVLPRTSSPSPAAAEPEHPGTAVVWAGVAWGDELPTWVSRRAGGSASDLRVGDEVALVRAPYVGPFRVQKLKWRLEEAFEVHVHFEALRLEHAEQRDRALACLRDAGFE